VGNFKQFCSKLGYIE